ncbi:DUF7507 domain-containing protein [Micromonospora eburnea]|uniref:DUF7507 domain-containing protein n=1 Tax=Micromonospora eburnea TaxID=227316 RepID=UPI00114D06CD|nr:DUF11 domain-containing protein [Micromonospora eburnea]
MSETFTGATADPRFEAFGSACLTGAPPGAPPPAGEHTLGGCSATPVGPVPPPGGAPFGYLQLTDASFDQAGAVLFNQAIPATQGLEVTFDQWQYGSTTPATPADGISFFLVNGAGNLTAPGAFGGSLGYAQKLPDDNPANPFLPGVNNGYLGIGLDVLGNYFGDWEHRGNGCQQRSPAGTIFRVPAPGPNMVTVRGPGNGTEGYCFLTATTSNFSTTPPWPSTLPGQLQGPTPVFPPNVTPEQAQNLLEPTRRRVTVQITPAPNPQVTVSIDFNDGRGSQQVLQFAAPEPVPATYKFGFAGSTGAFTDVHLIRNVTVTSAVPLPQLNLVKQVSLNQTLPPVIPVGTPVNYDFVVTNSGNVPINNLVVNDSHITNVSCPTTTLAPGQTITCTGTHIVTQADIDAGVIVDTAIATGTGPGGEQVNSPESEASLPVGNGTAELSLEKMAEPSTVTNAGQEITYRYVVTNTGTVTINNLRAADTAFSGRGTPPVVTCPSNTIAPSNQVVCTGTYTVTQADIDAGVNITNTATATGTGPNNQQVTSPPADASVAVVPAASLALVKSASPTEVTAAGQTVTYHFLVTNTGNVTLNNVQIHEVEFSGTGQLSAIDCAATPLAPGESTTCQATYEVTQADINAGTITDTANATATAPGGGTVTSNNSSATVNTTATTSLSLTKFAEPSSVSSAGEQISYRYVVTNTGTTTITNVNAADTAFSGRGTPPVVTCPVNTLAAGEQTICTATYTVVQADIDAGANITNTATATGTGPNQEQVTSPPSEATVHVVTAESLTLVKSAEPTEVTAAGQTITYSFLATNNGTVTLNNLRIHEVEFSGTGQPPAITCEVTTLGPGQSTTCQATYTVTQADIDAGKITDTANATATNPGGGTVTSNNSSATVRTAAVRAELTLVKSAKPQTVKKAGQKIKYSFTVTNTGTVPLTNVTVNETEFSGTGPRPEPVCPPEAASLAPGASVICTATYTVTKEDIKAGKITDTAVATGTGPNGEQVTSPPSTVTVTVQAAGRLEVVKTGRVVSAEDHDGKDRDDKGDGKDRDGKDHNRVRPGDQIEWTLTVTNVGTTTIRDITVTDSLENAITCPKTELAPGESMTCTVPPHTITEEDIKAGQVTNIATASGVTDTGVPVTAEGRATVKLESGELPVTGSNLTTPLTVGAVVTALGVLLVLASVRSVRRRVRRS